MSSINAAPIDTPLQMILRHVTPWVTWLESVRLALDRPTVTATLDFPNTAAQASSDLAVPFPDDTVALNDIPVVSPPSGSMLANSCYTAHIVNADEVVVRFNNYSAAAKNPASGDFTVVVFKR